MKITRKSDKEPDNATPMSLPVGVAAVIIFVAVIAAYIPAFNAQWIWDDDTSVFQNPVVTDRQDGLYRIWLTTDDYDFWPMTKTVFWLEYNIFRNKDLSESDDRDLQRVCHIVNIALHALASVLIYLLLMRLKVPAALLAALIFALHPVNASSVAWVAETKNTLSMVFFALTLLCHLRFERIGRWLWYAAALSAFALALASKTSVIMLPVVLLGLAWWRRGRIGRRDVLLAGPFFLLSAGMAAMTIFAQSRHFDALTNPLDGIYRLAGAGWVVWFYIYKALVPVNLSMIYPHWKETIQSLGWISFLPTAALVGLFVVLVAKRKTWWGRPALFAAGYVVLMLLPVLGFFKMTIMMHSLVADHFQYLPILGVISLLCAGAWELARRRPGEYRVLFVVVAVGVLAGLGILTWKRAEALKGKEPLWRDTVRKNPEAWMAQYKLGAYIANSSIEHINQSNVLHREAKNLRSRANALAAGGNQRQAGILMRQALEKKRQGDEKTQRVRALLLESVPHSRKATMLQPMDSRAFSNLGLTLIKLGRFDEGIEQYRRGIKADEYARPGRKNVILLHNFGLALIRKKQYAEAAALFKQVYLLQPRHVGAFKQALMALRALKRYDEIIELLNRQIKANPRDAGAYQDLAVAFFETGRTDQAMASVERSIELNRDNPRAHMTRADMLLASGKPGEAAGSYNVAIQLNRGRRLIDENRLRLKLASAQALSGSNAEAMANLMVVLKARGNHVRARAAVSELMKRIGQTPEAARCYERALSVMPGWVEGLRNLAWIRATHPDAAVRNTRQALNCANQLKARVGERNAVVMDTLAAALAQAGQFSEALAAAKTALDIAKNNKNEQLARDIEGRIKLYETGRPYREP